MDKEWANCIITSPTPWLNRTRAAIAKQQQGLLTLSGRQHCE
jgi:hypothetical protein